MPRPRLHDDALRARLLEVTSVVISTGGPEGVTVRDVARRAGTSPSAVYALFGSKDDLVVAVVDEAARRFGAHLASAGHSEDPGADLLALGLAYRRSALQEPHFYRVMFGGGPGGTRQQTVEITSEPTFGVLRDGVARVLVATTGAPAQPQAAVEPALALWALVHGLVALELADLMPGDERERVERYVAALRAAGPAIVSAVREPVSPPDGTLEAEGTDGSQAPAER